MFQRALVAIAGVDRDTLKTCPATDKLWAAHLGFALVLSFVVVLGISFHATGYMIADPWMRGAVSLVIALTVFMFDRALYQSDWFYQGFLWSPGRGAEADASGGRSARRFLRIAIRLSMSFGLAWVIAVFLELAIFSDTISDKLKRDHVTVNQPVYQKVEQYEAQQAAEIEQRRSNLAALEALLRNELATPPPAEAPAPAQVNDLEEQIKALDAQESGLRAELRQIQEQIKTYSADMNAEQLGQRLNAANSGRAGAGPRYQFAKQQKDVYEEQRVARESEIAQLRAKRDDIRAAQARIAADAAARSNQARFAVQSKRDLLQTQIDVARADLKQREAARLASVEEFRRGALAASDFQKQKDDPLSRMTAYQELKSDPKDGATITLFSWMTKFLIIFLEIVPVVAKLFFSPPSVYAARIQAEVERERWRIQREKETPVVDRAPEIPDRKPEIEQAMEEIAAEIRQEASVPRSRSFAPQLAEFESQGQGADTVQRTADPERAPPIVPPSRQPSTRGGQPEARPGRVGERDGEAARRREMELLIAGESGKKAGPRAKGRQTGEPDNAVREVKDRPELSFLLQDDIPQKP